MPPGTALEKMCKKNQCNKRKKSKLFDHEYSGLAIRLEWLKEGVL
jgi:hypothetical protein